MRISLNNSAIKVMPLAMRGNHFAAFGEFLGYSQPWPELNIRFLVWRLGTKLGTLACGSSKP
jgi:hypothetical protein